MPATFSSTQNQMRLAIVIFCFLLAANVVAGQATDKIAAIRKTAEAINNTRGYKIKVYNFDDTEEVADNGQELKGYYQNGHLKKIVYSVGLSNCMKTFEYYFSDAGLIFVFEKEDDYPEKKDHSGLDFTKLVPAFEGRYYIAKGKVIQSKLKGHEQSTAANTADMLSTLKYLMDDLKTAKVM